MKTPIAVLSILGSGLILGLILIILGFTNTYTYFDEVYDSNGNDTGCGLLTGALTKSSTDNIFFDINFNNGLVVVVTDPEVDKSFSIAEGLCRVVISGKLKQYDFSLITWNSKLHCEFSVDGLLITKSISALGFTNEVYRGGAGRRQKTNVDDAYRNLSEVVAAMGQTYTVSYTYDVDNHQTSCPYPDTTVIHKTFTDRHQLNSVKNSTVAILDSTFDEGMREVSRPFGNGNKTIFDYNADNAKYTISTEAGEQVANNELTFRYLYQANKNVTSETQVAGNTTGYSCTAGFDSKDRVTSHTRTNGNIQSWNLSLVGNWNSSTVNGSISHRTHNSVLELSTIDGSSLSHDSKGNNLTISNSNYKASYDIVNVHYFAHATDSNLDVAIIIDVLGRRVTKSHNGETTVFTCSGPRVVVEYEAIDIMNFSKTNSYVFGNYIDDPVMMINSSSTKHYYHCDRQYNVRGLSGSTGAVVELYAYSVHGERLNYRENIGA